MILVGDHRLLPYLAKADLYLRCTLSDTFGASVAESLSLQVPVVASDVCERPSGTIIFKMDDFQDLLRKAGQALRSKDKSHQSCQPVEDSFKDILKAYERLLSL